MHDMCTDFAEKLSFKIKNFFKIVFFLYFFTCSFFESDNTITLEDASEISHWQRMDKKCLLLLQSLVTEQLKHDFHNNTALQNLNSTNSIQFKFFLNTLEMFAQSIGIIRLENYAYRIKNYGQFEVRIILE